MSLLVSAFAGVSPSPAQPDPFISMQALRVRPPAPAPDVTFQALDGRPVRLAMFRGRPVRLGVTDPRSANVQDCKRSAWLGPSAAWASGGSHGIVMHSARMVLVDRAGQVRAYHLATDENSMARLRANLGRLLRAPADRER